MQLLQSCAAVAWLVATFTGLPVVRAQSSLTHVSDWGENPSKLELEVYVPAKLAPKPAVILAVRDLFLVADPALS